jgi:hypothetical protein
LVIALEIVLALVLLAACRSIIGYEDGEPISAADEPSSDAAQVVKASGDVARPDSRDADPALADTGTDSALDSGTPCIGPDAGVPPSCIGLSVRARRRRRLLRPVSIEVGS